MTKKEAIDLLDNLIGFIEDNHGSDYDEALKIAIKTLEQKPCEDAISRKSIKQKLQEHHDFFVNAYGGFSNLPQNYKSRVDEITNCIAMVVNEPPITPQTLDQEPKTGHWIGIDEEPHEDYECDKCGYVVSTFTANIEPHTEYKFCPNCGARMESEDKWKNQ